MGLEHVQRGARAERRSRRGRGYSFSPTHPFLPYVAPHFSHISHFNLVFSGGASKRNPGEARAVLAIVQSVVRAGELRLPEIGVVTPYAAQVHLLRQLAHDLPGGRALEILSVDGFQGREKELIIFSSVRSGRGGALGFVADERRINVLLTRARRGLVVVGDPKTLVGSRHWADWLEFVEREGAVVGNPKWRMPTRPASYARSRSPEPDAEIDALGRIVRSGGGDESDSEGEATREGAKGPAQFKNAATRRKAARRARRLAAAEGGGGGDENGDGNDEERHWREALKHAAENAEREETLALARAGGEVISGAWGADDDDFIPPPPPETAESWQWQADAGDIESEYTVSLKDKKKQEKRKKTLFSPSLPKCRTPAFATSQKNNAFPYLRTCMR